MERRIVRICRAGDQLSVGDEFALEHAFRGIGRRGRLFTFQDIKADAAELVHVGVKNLGEETDLGRDHRIVVGEEELELECAT